MGSELKQECLGGCRRVLPHDKFVRNRGCPGGRTKICRRCKRRENNVFYRAQPGRGRRSALKNRYNMSPAEFDAIVEAQGGLCACCGDEPATSVDHDHACCPGRKTCGQCIRGILCRRCNTQAVPSVEAGSDLKARSYLGLAA